MLSPNRHVSASTVDSATLPGGSVWLRPLSETENLARGPAPCVRHNTITSPTFQPGDAVQRQLALGKRRLTTEDAASVGPGEQHAQNKTVANSKELQRQVELAVSRAKLKTKQRLTKRFRKYMKEREEHLRELWEEEHDEAMVAKEHEIDAIGEEREEEASKELQRLEAILGEIDDAADERSLELENILLAEQEVSREAQQLTEVLEESLRTAQREAGRLRTALRNLSDETQDPPRSTDNSAPAITTEAHAPPPGLECIACMVERKIWMCSPCRHLVYCDDCVRRARDATCPVCRKACRRFAKVYL